MNDGDDGNVLHHVAIALGHLHNDLNSTELLKVSEFLAFHQEDKISLKR